MMPLKRPRIDTRLAIMMVFGTVAVLVITPFAVYYFAVGNMARASSDLFLMLGIVAAVAYAWRGGDVERASTAAAVLAALACLGDIAREGAVGVPWVYPLLLVISLLVNRRKAAFISVLLIAAAASFGNAFDGPMERLLFVGTALAVSGFAFVYAHLTETQRQRLQALATHDPLTGAFNRRAMEQELEVAVATMDRERAPVGLAVMDLDHFKRINDNYGHEAGDHVLVEFVRLVIANTRKGDRLFRFGGEEFALLLPGAYPAALHNLTDALRGTVANQLRYQDQVITISIGAATLLPGEDAAAWLARADAAMYRAKNEGRNRVVVDDPRDPASPVATPG